VERQQQWLQRTLRDWLEERLQGDVIGAAGETVAGVCRAYCVIEAIIRASCSKGRPRAVRLAGSL